jgi:hypothetical protein
MAGLVTWIGVTANTEINTSPRRTYTASRNEVTRIFEGKYSTLLAGKPDIGSVMSGYSGYTVERVEVSNVEGTKGQMVIGLAQEISAGFVTGTTDNSVYEIEWCQVERKIETHPIFASGGDLVLTDDDRNDIKAWQDEQEPTLRKAFSYDVNGDTGTLGPNAQEFALKILKGEESYLVFIPVLRKTSQGYAPPSTSTCGKRETPTGFPSVPAGYTFVKTADRGQRTGKASKWERQEEWTGFDNVDADLYPAA